MSHDVTTVLVEIGEYLPIIVSVALLMIFQVVNKALRKCLGVDMSDDGGILGLLSLILVVTYSILLVGGKEVPGHLLNTIAIVFVSFLALVIYDRRK